MLETERLVVRELEAEDLEAVLDVYTSNPDYRALTEGSAGEPGRYDLGMLERDVAVAGITPGRHMLGLFLRENGEAVGILDWMEENPSDGLPWVGLLMTHAERQREGLATEAFEGFAEMLRARGAKTVRAGVIAGNAAGQALARRLGFVPQFTTTQGVDVVERPL